MATLEELVVRGAALPADDLRARLQWLEDTAAAVEAADLGDAGDSIARDFRACLGAIVMFSRRDTHSETDNGERAQLELGLLLRTLQARALYTLFHTLGGMWRALAHEKHPRRAVCVDVADAFDALARAVRAGDPPPASALQKLRAADQSLKNG